MTCLPVKTATKVSGTYCQNSKEVWKYSVFLTTFGDNISFIIYNFILCVLRDIEGTRQFDYISPVLRQLHWLPVRQRVEFKVANLVHEAMCGHASCYVAGDCCVVTASRQRRIRSADTRSLLSVWRAPISTDIIQQDLWYNCLRESMKKFLFGQWVQISV